VAWVEWNLNQPELARSPDRPEPTGGSVVGDERAQ